MKGFPNFTEAISNNVLIYNPTTKYFESVKDEKITTIGVDIDQRNRNGWSSEQEYTDNRNGWYSEQEYTDNRKFLLHSFNDQPSRKVEFESGRSCIQFHQFEKLHRIQGPAEILYLEDGVTILEKYFWLYGVNVTEEFFRIYVRDLKIEDVLDESF